VTLPLILSGDFFVVVDTDNLQQIGEFPNENNNITVSATPIRIEQKPLPNLQATAITPPSEALSGQETEVRWVVTNTGTGATENFSWRDRVFLSRDDVLDADDILLGSALNPSHLNPGEGYSESLTVALPEGLTGDFRIIVFTDSNNSVPELEGENDNVTVSGAFTVKLAPPPNLIVDSVIAPARAFSGGLLSLTWTVANSGTGATSGDRWADRVFMSEDDVFDTGDTFLGDFTHEGRLLPDQSYTASGEVRLPVGRSGNFHFFILTDALDQVFEHVGDEDNFGRTSAPTPVELTPPPDLKAEIIAAPDAGLAGHAVEFTYRVTNFGSTATPNLGWRDGFFLSLDGDLDASDIALPDAVHGGRLEVDGFYESTVTLTLPNGISG